MNIFIRSAHIWIIWRPFSTGIYMVAIDIH